MGMNKVNHKVDVLEWTDTAPLHLPDRWDEISSSLADIPLGSQLADAEAEAIPTRSAWQEAQKREILRGILVALAVMVLVAASVFTLQRSLSGRVIAPASRGLSIETDGPMENEINARLIKYTYIFSFPSFGTDEALVRAVSGDLSGMVNTPSMDQEEVFQLIQDSGIRKQGGFYRLQYVPPLVEPYDTVISTEKVIRFFWYTGGEMDQLFWVSWFHSDSAFADTFQEQIDEQIYGDSIRPGYYIRVVDSEEYDILWQQEEQWFNARIPVDFGVEHALDLCAMEFVPLP